MMRHRILFTIVAALSVLLDQRALADRPLVFVHYMPWFQADKASPTVWGWHWTMGKLDPNRIAGGQPELASHYHPVIGPYDSADPDVLEYHTLLMKVAGIDGVIADWYGQEDVNDYLFVHRSTVALFDTAAKCGLQFAVCLEDRILATPRLATATTHPAVVACGKELLAFLVRTWMGQPGYLLISGRPALFVFGPIGATGEQWRDILATPRPEDGAVRPILLTLHHAVGPAEGVFDWPLPNEGGVKRSLKFTASVAKPLVAVPVVYPRFHDFYLQAGVGPGYGSIDDDHGKTFSSLLKQALSTHAAVVQIATWNDWGEGTQIEPSVEFGYRDLEAIQQSRRAAEPDFPFDVASLKLPAEIFRQRHLAHGEAAKMRALDQVAALLRSGQAADAAKNLSAAAVH